mmetsp:Transcript_32904/g.29792  ORF Transcript_32904/g.29792 Transcript_32904/m.29792 type:complete len:112 (+) Transcript_32904:134-469(+)
MLVNLIKSKFRKLWEKEKALHFLFLVAINSYDEKDSVTDTYLAGKGPFSSSRNIKAYIIKMLEILEKTTYNSTFLNKMISSTKVALLKRITDKIEISKSLMNEVSRDAERD